MINSMLRHENDNLLNIIDLGGQRTSNPKTVITNLPIIRKKTTSNNSGAN